MKTLESSAVTWCWILTEISSAELSKLSMNGSQIAIQEGCRPDPKHSYAIFTTMSKKLGDTQIRKAAAESTAVSAENHRRAPSK